MLSCRMSLVCEYIILSVLPIVISLLLGVGGIVKRAVTSDIDIIFVGISQF